MTLTILQNMQLASCIDTLLRLMAAFVLGGLVGYERQYRQRTAGLRTNVLVAVGAAIFVDMAILVDGSEGGARAVSYVISGIGFLGAGVIIREQGRVSGLNTAATLWGAAAIGACAGAGLLVEAILAALFVLAANTFLRPLANAMNRQPLPVEAVEASVEVHIIAKNEQLNDALVLLTRLLHATDHVAQDLDVRPFGEEQAQIEATFAAGAVATSFLEELTRTLNAAACVENAYWSPEFQE